MQGFGIDCILHKRDPQTEHSKPPRFRGGLWSTSGLLKDTVCLDDTHPTSQGNNTSNMQLWLLSTSHKGIFRSARSVDDIVSHSLSRSDNPGPISTTTNSTDILFRHISQRTYRRDSGDFSSRTMRLQQFEQLWFPVTRSLQN